MSRKVLVAGVGMIPFTKAGASDDYPVMGANAARAALADARVDYALVEQAYVGYVYGDSTAGQAAIYGVGLTGIPVINVNNNCATGSTALFLARQAVASGAIECAIAVGFEQMVPGALKGAYTDRPSPMARFVDAMEAIQGFDDAAPRAAQFFGGAGRDYIKEYDIRPDTFGRISVKARQHAARNPFAVFRNTVTLEEVMASPAVFDPLTRLQCCPPTCGAAAAILCSEEFAKRHGLDTRVAIRAQSMTTDRNSTFDEGDMRKVVGYDMTRAAAQAVYEAAGVSPTDIDVVELHDCFTANELITYEGLGLTPEGTAEKFILDGDNTYGGRVVTNPSGGLLSKGHPLGATGLAQCAELVWQLRGQAQDRQVPGARLALQHNLGLGGACVVTLYERQ
ncbi:MULTISPECIES: lipid-transfer protein [unclassified Cupriavidus]|uniref:lipid-transfer protein n=1 Tax=unclassified Cupriavidus TaxID=2640874 RepID=UPI001BFFE98F|nr:MULTISPECIES: lipid-transfer protein [unclassified Cupriavidus]MCA3183013.1 lipid-transfer protein [Cupriavidus sp.]MCA3188914.1 lipid-transfer protein [Cupriavidus sp.]MCA3198634.1 lipid-transfer protein [Cupriavidus sp.]MCA3201380.1 lipid-transfer protein [Cupriavidus sp.]MCA3209773.1 lipid-transfer protein [Cupriavidus sp.]